MVVHRPLDEVLGTWSHVAVLRVLQDSVQGLSGRELARLALISPRACLQALTHLENLSLIVRQRGGRDHLFSLNREHILVAKGIIPLLTLERNFLGQILSMIKRISGKYCKSIILFGSVSTKTETFASDLDVCFVVNSENEKKTLSEQLIKLTPELKKLFGVNLAPFVVTQKQFMNKGKRKSPPLNSIIQDGVYVSGLSIRELLNGKKR